MNVESILASWNEMQGFASQWLFWANDNSNLVVITSVLVSWVAVITALVCLVKMKKQANNALALYQRLNQDLQVASSSAVGMGKRIISVEKQLASQHHTSASVMPLPAATPEPKSEPQLSSFDQAKLLLREGMDVAEVARRCGLSKSEASLMAMIQDRSSSATSALG